MALVAAIFGPEHFIVYSAAEAAISPESISRETNLRVCFAALQQFGLGTFCAAESEESRRR